MDENTNEAANSADALPPMAEPLAEPAPEAQHTARVRKPRTRKQSAEPEQIGGAVDQVVSQAKANGERKPYPDPFGIETIALTDQPEGPEMHLARSQRYQRMEMRFDENPGEEVRGVLKERGWSWKGQEQAWTLPLDRDARYAEHMAAEKLFRDIGNTIREQNGLAPVGQLAVA